MEILSLFAFYFVGSILVVLIVKFNNKYLPSDPPHPENEPSYLFTAMILSWVAVAILLAMMVSDIPKTKLFKKLSGWTKK